MKKYIVGWVLFKLILLGVFALFTFSNFQFEQFAQTAIAPTPTPSDKIDRPTSNPYTGDLARFDRENRAEKLQIEKVMDILQISEGKQVADIGAGGGWFTTIAAKRVGEKGKVYAVDISEESILFINERKVKEKFTNIETVLSTEENPLLPKKKIDSVLILNTYHEISEPIVFLKNLYTALRKNALIGIIDRNGSGDDHGIDEAKVIEEAKRAGFSLKEKHYFVKDDNMDYFLIFKIEDKK